jgi:hypothetical protein
MEAFAAIGSAMTAAGPALTAIGTVVSAAGAMQAAEAQAENAQSQAAAAQYQSQVDQRNATIAQNNATSVEQQTAAREEAQRRRFALLQGEAYAGMGQSGTDPTSGSNLDVLKQNSINNALDALDIRYSGKMAADNYTNQSVNYQSQSSLDLMNASRMNNAASSATTAGYFNAGANLLSGAAKYSYYTGGFNSNPAGMLNN